MELKDEYVIKFNCENLDPESIEVEEAEELQLLKIGKESLLVRGSDELGCEVHNYAEFNEFFNVVQFQDLFKSISSVEFTLPEDFGFKFKVTGVNFKDRKEVAFGFVPVYSEQNGYYDPSVEISKVNENVEIIQGQFDCSGKEC